MADEAAAEEADDSGAGSGAPVLCGQDAGPVALAAGMAELGGLKVSEVAAVDDGKEVWLDSCSLVVRSMPDD